MCQFLAQQFTVAMRSTGENSLLMLCEYATCLSNCNLTTGWQIPLRLPHLVYTLHCITIDTGGCRWVQPKSCKWWKQHSCVWSDAMYAVSLVNCWAIPSNWSPMEVTSWSLIHDPLQRAVWMIHSDMTTYYNHFTFQAVTLWCSWEWFSALDLAVQPWWSTLHCPISGFEHETCCSSCLGI